MNQAEIRDYVESYLEAQQCEIILRDPSYLTTQLSVEVDKDIANRPYYWMFVERTGSDPQPLQLTFIFDEENIDENIRGELLKFGCWRLHQIFQSAQQHGQFIRLYEEVSTSLSTQGLVPWLLVNYKISFISDQKKDIFYPLGYNLISGQIITQFEEVLDQFNLTPKIPDYHFTLRPIYSIQSAVAHIETHMRAFLEEQDEQWAIEANERLDEEVELLRSFFSSSHSDHQLTLATKIEEIDSYRPKIEVNHINLGLIYLQTNPVSKIR
jgi:hypothetical protein